MFALNSAFILSLLGLKQRKLLVFIDFHLSLHSPGISSHLSSLIFLVIVLVLFFVRSVILYSGFQFIDHLLGLFFSLWLTCLRWLPLDGYIIDIDSLALCFSFTLSLTLSLLLRLLYLLNQCHLRHKLWLRIDFNYFHIRIIIFLIIYLPSIFLQQFLRMLIFLMYSSNSRIELFLPIFKPRIIYLCISLIHLLLNPINNL